MLFNIIFIIMILYIIIKIFFVKITISHLQDIILLSSLFFLVTITLRLIIRTFQKQLLKINIGSRKVIIVGAGKNTEKLINQMNVGSTCSICLQDNVDSYFNPCGHTACSNCINKNSEYDRPCPLCRKQVRSIHKLFFN